MSAAALTPRVRTIVICDDVSASLTEEGVFTLEGVRYHLTVSSLPWRRGLDLFLLLSSARQGEYSGRVLVISERTDKAVRYVKFLAPFDEDNQLLVMYVELGECVFPHAGQYSIEISFSSGTGSDALKGEHPFFIVLHEE
jgi:hypothetical protein